MTPFQTLLRNFGYKLTQGFGRTPFAISSGIYDKWGGLHDGVDYDYIEQENKNCKVLVPGKVLYVGDRSRHGRAYGLVVEMEIKPGVTFTYCHLDSVFRTARRGDFRQVGDDIGVIGESGNTRGAHVHLIGRENGRSVDPRKIINDFYQQGKEKNDEVYFAGDQLLTRIGENYEILMRYPNVFISHKYRYVEGDFHWNGQHFRKFVTWWARHRTKEDFQKAVEADFQAWRREQKVIS